MGGTRTPDLRVVPGKPGGQGGAEVFHPKCQSDLGFVYRRNDVLRYIDQSVALRDERSTGRM